MVARNNLHIIIYFTISLIKHGQVPKRDLINLGINIRHIYLLIIKGSDTHSDLDGLYDDLIFRYFVF